MIRNLGKALTILAKAEAQEIAMHEDVDIMHAPEECHGLVAKGEAQRRRRARKHAEAVAGRSLKFIRREAWKRGVIYPLSGCPHWEDFVGRLAWKMSPYYCG